MSAGATPREHWTLIISPELDAASWHPARIDVELGVALRREKPSLLTGREKEYVSIEQASGAIGPKWPVICDGKEGYFDMSSAGSEFVSTNSAFRFFAYEHLPERLRHISKHFHGLAERVVLTVPMGQERTKALDRLLESKDAAVRAFL